MQGIRDEELILAKRSINGNNFQWTVPVAPGETWRKLGDASALEQNAIMNHVCAYKRKAAQVLGVDQEIIDAIFSTPNDSECIYFCTSDGKLRVFIVGWDFVKSSAGRSRGVLTEDTKKQKQEVVIRFVKDGKPTPDFPFVLSLPTGFSRSYKMPGNGMFRLGMIEIGLSIEIDINNGQMADSFTVNKGQTIYEFDLTEPVEKSQDNQELPVEPEKSKTLEKTEVPDVIEEPEVSEEPEEPEVSEEPEKPEVSEEPEKPEVSEEPVHEPQRRVEPLLRVIDSNGTPVDAFPIDILFPDKHGAHVLTDEKGEYKLPEMTEGEKFVVTDDFSKVNTTFTINLDQIEYVLNIDYAFVIQNPDIKIKVIDEKGKPVYPGWIALHQQGCTLLIRQKEDGTFVLSNGYFKYNEPIEVMLVDSGKKEYSSKNFTLVESEKEYTIQLDTKDCPWWIKLFEWLFATAAVMGCVHAYEPVYRCLSSIVESTY